MINSGLFVLLFFHALHCQPMWLFLLNNTRLISLKKLSYFIQAMQEYMGVHAPPGACNVQKYTRKHNKGIFVGFMKTQWMPNGRRAYISTLFAAPQGRLEVNHQFKCMLQCVCYIWLINKRCRWTNYILRFANRLDVDQVAAWLRKKSTDYLLILPLVQPNVTLILIGAAIMRK